MAKSDTRKLFIQASHYSIANLLTQVIGGLVTFPTLTRVFTVEQYGALSFVGATLAFAVAFGKTGVQHSVVRLFAPVSAGKSEFTLPQLYSTTIIGMSASATLAGAVLIGFALLVPQHFLEHPGLRLPLALVSVLVVIQATDSGLSNLLRAAERSGLLLKYQVAKKYLSIALILTALLLIHRSLTAFYIASITAEGLSLTILLSHALRGRDLLSPKYFSKSLYLQVIAYGLPMMIGYELSGAILSLGDRYVIKAKIGDEQLGLYSAAYNMCQYIGAAVVYSFSQAVMPVYIRMATQEGYEKASAFTTRSLGHYLLLVTPVVAGVASIGSYLLPALASSKYAAAAPVLPWVIGGMALDGVSNFLGAGLYIEKHPRLLMGLTTGSAIFNVALNIVLVPRLGIVGAAAATLVCYLAMCIAYAYAGGRYLPVRMPWATLLRAGAGSIAMYAVLRFVEFDHLLVTVVVRCMAGAVVYATVIVAIDGEARSMARKAFEVLQRRLAARRAGPGALGGGSE
jgi:O-antigen/teichoic acid export membrane protein